MINPFATETELRILAALQDGPVLYGLQIQEKAQVKRGTVYTTLKRMEDRGLVRSKVTKSMAKVAHPGLPRPLYSITEAGKRMLAAWSALNQNSRP